MILLDANILIYAYVEDIPQYQSINPWFNEQLNSGIKIGLPWPTLLAFMRILSNSRIVKRPSPIPKLWKQAQSWISLPTTWIPTPQERYSGILNRVIKDISSSQLIPDAALAALAIEHGLTLCSADGDFARFKELQWHNPLTQTK